MLNRFIQSFTKPSPRSVKIQFLLLLNDKLDLDSGSDRLPLTVFTEEVQKSGNRIFLDVPFVIETSQVEKIALDQVTRQH
jgi:hypothetical protein